ncbi:hypothetical protein [Gracilibacillus alcaliphilus]|uniref:hypothetical protein n=1 Tax=Gracilibacillus alcaliphilus TaxID=1401441 RepID=UPI0019590D4C|nr:hypothetical protein [Gracilibacillus alcaliphilus]MBM7679775.1 NADPH-dependent curcumin reductase CurA [Gracilibacillus alcaliphilus]
MNTSGRQIRIYFHLKAMEGVYWLACSAVCNGELKCEETIYEGFQVIPAAFIGVFFGEGTGKYSKLIDKKPSY